MQPGKLSKLKHVFHMYEPMIQKMEDEEGDKIQMYTQPTIESDRVVSEGRCSGTYPQSLHL